MSLLRFCMVVEREEECKHPNSKPFRHNEADHHDSDSDVEVILMNCQNLPAMKMIAVD